MRALNFSAWMTARSASSEPEIGETPSPRSRASASLSSSRSMNRCGSRLRAANSRNRRVSGEYREPTILRPVPSSIRIDRRSR